MPDFKGGRYELEINGKVYSGTGKASIDTAGVTLSNAANQDGSKRTTVAAKLVMIDLTFDRGERTTKWDASMMLADLSVIFAETDAKVTHTLTAANWEGSPVLDTSTGEISGCKIACAPSTYSQLTA